MSAIENLKTRLSTLHKDAWHRRLATFAYGKRSINKTNKACPYWWLIVPTSLPVAGLKCVGYVLGVLSLVVVGAIMSLIVYVSRIVQVFLGYSPKTWAFPFSDEPNAMELKVYPYKRGRSSTGPQKRLAPYQWALPLMFIAGLITTFVLSSGQVTHAIKQIFDASWVYIAWAALALGALCILGLVFKHIVVPFLKTKYEAWCPEITWLEGEGPEPDPEAASAA